MKPALMSLTSLALMTMLLTLSGCRTEYKSDVTTQCTQEATDTIAKRRLAADGGPFEWKDQDSLCQDCCHSRGYSNVEPGYCSCGKMGLDALMK